MQIQHGAVSVQYFGRVGTLSSPYHVFECRDQLGRTRFVVSANLTDWIELPELDNEEVAELDRLGFGLASRLPFWGKPEKRLPKEPAAEAAEEEADDEKEEEEKESDADSDDEDTENSEDAEEGEEAEEKQSENPEDSQNVENQETPEN